MGKRKRPMSYRLEGHTPIPCQNMLDSSIADPLVDRRVALDKVGDGWELSTVFLGFDHNHHALALNLPVTESPPLIFETALFRDGRVEILERYSTWQEALEGHHRCLGELLQTISAILPPDKPDITT